jgi:hypothetical protein
MCWENALKRKVLNRALRVVLTPEEVAQLRAYAQSLKDRAQTLGLGLPGSEARPNPAGAQAQEDQGRPPAAPERRS